MSKHTIETAVDIDAPVEHVWRALTDFADYQQWGDYMPNDVEPSKRAEELAVAFLSRVWNGTSNDLSAIDELMTEDYQVHSAMKTVSGRDAFRQWVSDFQNVLTNAQRHPRSLRQCGRRPRGCAVDVLGSQQRDVRASRRWAPHQVLGDRHLACRERTARGMLDRTRGS